MAALYRHWHWIGRGVKQGHHGSFPLRLVVAGLVRGTVIRPYTGVPRARRLRFA